MSAIAILGSGSWGTAFAKVLADADASADVRIVARRPEVVQAIREEHLNREYFPDIELPRNVTATTDLAEALDGAEVLVVAVPAQSARSLMAQVRPLLGERTLVLSLMKGLEQGTHLRMSQMLSETLGLPSERIAILSGPNLAREIMEEQPTASVISCRDEGAAAALAKMCTAPYFRPYTNTDVVGVELGGIVKNIIALAVGICAGQGMGDNSKASLMTRGLAETTRLALALGASGHTMAGLAGMGDLVATCASPLSRNHRAGRLLAEGLSVSEIAQEMSQVAEGIKSASAVAELAQQHEVQMPITEAVVAVISGELAVADMGAKLMGRDLKPEGEL